MIRLPIFHGRRSRLVRASGRVAIFTVLEIRFPRRRVTYTLRRHRVVRGGR